MSRSVNQVILLGNITRDPEVRQTLNGQKIVTFGLATNREWTGPDGKKNSLAEYHNIVAFGALAELCTKLLTKGVLVYIQGYLKTRSWDHESGVKVFRTEIVADHMIRLGGRDKISPDGENENENKDKEKMEAFNGTPQETTDATFDDDDFFSEAPAPNESEEKKL